MICEILSVGTEILMGQIANTDAQYLSQQMSELGISVYHHTAVGDNPARVREALGQALSRSDLVITTGGLGPTEDDLTKEMVAEYFGLKLTPDPASLEAIRARVTVNGRELTQNQLKQGYFPEGSHILPNQRGTAPGCVVKRDGKLVAVLPGPPRELRDMFEKQLKPYLARLRDWRLDSRYLKIFGVGEAQVEVKLKDLFHSDNPTLALYCGAGEVTARLTAGCAPDGDTARLLDPLEAEIRRRLGDAVYAQGRESTLAQAVLELMSARGETLAVAESLTGGMLASALVDCPGASRVLTQGFVTYCDQAKARVLGVSAQTLNEHGAVSAQCACEMAQGALGVSGADYALSTTGIAGPDGALPDKPVGTVFIALACASGVTCERFLFANNDRAWVRTLSVQNALNMLRLNLLSRHGAPDA